LITGETKKERKEMRKRIGNAVIQKALSILSLLLFISSIAEAKVPDIVLKHKKAVVTIYVFMGEDHTTTGTGFIVDSDGIIATNYHVISELLEEKDASGLFVKLENGALFFTEDIISFNKDNDIALLKVEGKGLPKVKLTSTYKSKQGESIVVIGSPNGLETTVSEGIISSIRKKDRLQITAPISGGSSGSPVFNLKGEVIGVVTSSIDSGQNLNFAIPVSGVASLFNDYKKSKKKVMPAQKALTSVSTPEAMVKLEEAKTEVKKNPDNAETHNNLGLCYTKLGKYDMAKEAFKQALRIMPDFAEAHYNLGVAYGKLDMYREALEAYKQAIKIKPDYAKAHFNLGIVYIILDDRGSALEEYKILKELNREMANDFFNKIYE
jgi:S1-C subfamily serine protease